MDNVFKFEPMTGGADFNKLTEGTLLRHVPTGEIYIVIDNNHDGSVTAVHVVRAADPKERERAT